MLLGFKDQFVAYVREGSKTHTFRVKSKRRPFRVGDDCDCYEKVRQKKIFDKTGKQVAGMMIIGSWPCVDTEDARIDFGPAHNSLRMWVDGIELSKDEVEAFFKRDGFRKPSESSTAQAWAFWFDQLPVEGQIIHWTFKEPAITRERTIALQRASTHKRTISSKRATPAKRTIADKRASRMQRTIGP